MQALVALALGAGLKAQELSSLVGSDVEKTDGGILITLPEVFGPRVVPVHARWEDEVWAAAQRVEGRPIVLPARQTVYRSDLSRLLEKVSEPGSPEIKVARLRVTWVLRQLASGVRLDAVARAAGVNPTQLAKYVRFLPPLGEDEARAALRGSGWDR